jgi:hypothetical protein
MCIGLEQWGKLQHNLVQDHSSGTDIPVYVHVLLWAAAWANPEVTVCSVP